LKPKPHSISRPASRVWLLAAVLALGLGLRIANLADTSDSPFFSRTVLDGRAYDRWALAIIGRAEGSAAAATMNGPFYQDPLYPYFLASIYGVFGHSYWAVYLIQLALSMVLLLLVYDAARRLFDWRAGIAAAAMAALYKPLIFYEGQVEKTALAVFLTALFVWLFVRASSLKPPTTSRSSPAGRWLWPFASGIALGLAALTRANTLLFAPLLPLALVLGRKGAGRRTQIGAAAAGLFGVLVVIAPVSVRNSLLAHEFTLTTTQAGQNLYIGNSSYNTTGLFEAPPWVRPNPDFMESDFAEYARRATGRVLSPGQVSRFYSRAALDWARTRPGDFARLLWRKTVLYFNNFEVPDNQDMYFSARYSWVLRLPLFSFGVVFALGLAAIVLLARGLSRLSVAAFFFVYAVSVIGFFVFARYRLPALAALLPFAGAMLPWFADEFRRQASPGRRGGSQTSRRYSLSPRLAGASAITLATLALTLYPIRSSTARGNAAQSLTNLAVYFCEEGDTARAVENYEEALVIRPAQPVASLNLGLIMLARNEVGRAVDLLSAAASSDPTNPFAHAGLGKCYQRQGQFDSSRVEARRAIALDPARIEFRFALATALQQTDSYPQALAQYDTMVRLDRNNSAVRHNFAVCLYKLGRLDEARTQLEAARVLGAQVNPVFDSLLNPGRRTAHSPGR